MNLPRTRNYAALWLAVPCGLQTFVYPMFLFLVVVVVVEVVVVVVVVAVVVVLAAEFVVVPVVAHGAFFTADWCVVR